MNKKSLKAIAVAGAAALLLTSCSGSGGGGSDEIVIGAAYSVTGPFASIDSPALNGFKLAAKQINEDGGILGQQVKVVHSDAQSNTTTLTNVISEYIDNDGAVAIGGTNDSTQALAAGPIAQAAQVPFVATGATLPTLPEQVGDYFYMACFGDDAQAYAIADYAAEELDGESVWVLTDQAYDFTTALSKFFKERWVDNGGEVVLEDSYRSGDTDYSAQISRLQAMSTQPDMLFVSAIPNEAGIITEQLRAAGLTQPILSGDGYDTPLLIDVAGSNATEVFFATHVSLDSPAENVASFVAAYKEEYGSAPENAFAALGYDTMYLIADAIERAGEASPDAIRDALAQTKDLELVTGKLTFPDGVRTPVKAVSIIEAQDGKLGFLSEVTP